MTEFCVTRLSVCVCACDKVVYAKVVCDRVVDKFA